MFNTENYSLADAMAGSENYKIIQNGGWIYVFPADSNFKALADSLNSARWESTAVLVVDIYGNVISNRFGAITKHE